MPKKILEILPVICLAASTAFAAQYGFVGQWKFDPLRSSFWMKLEKFVPSEYETALPARSTLPEAQRQAIAEKLRNYIGLPTTYLSSLESDEAVNEDVPQFVRDTESGK